MVAASYALENSQSILSIGESIQAMPPKGVFPNDGKLLPFDADVHAPFVGLINPKSGGQMGTPILEVVKRTEVYQDNIFHIVDVIKSAKERGGLLDQFRRKLCDAKLAASGKAEHFRPRLICGGGDGTGSFALMIVFKVLAADNTRADEGMSDKGNGFIWTDEEMSRYFPALVQMPLGTGNDLSGCLGWGRKYPGHVGKCCLAGPGRRLHNLQSWFNRALDVTSPLANFDVWGFMPPPGEDKMEVKLCDLATVSKASGQTHLKFRHADVVVPFLVLLYASYGFGGQMIARFQLARTNSQFHNFVQYLKIGPAIFCGKNPQELRYNMDGFSVTNVAGEPLEKNGTDQYFPPRKTRAAKSYGEVGFMNLNSYGGGSLKGRDRARCCHRWIICRGPKERRQPIRFDDGKLDLFRQRIPATVAKTGNTIQTDKRSGATFRFQATESQGIFMQYDGEGRFVFHPDGKDWRMDVHQVLRIPVVLGKPSLKNPDSEPISFGFIGDEAEVRRIKARITKWVNGELVPELNASSEEIEKGGLLPEVVEDKKE